MIEPSDPQSAQLTFLEVQSRDVSLSQLENLNSPFGGSSNREMLQICEGIARRCSEEDASLEFDERSDLLDLFASEKHSNRPILDGLLLRFSLSLSSEIFVTFVEVGKADYQRSDVCPGLKSFEEPRCFGEVELSVTTAWVAIESAEGRIMERMTRYESGAKGCDSLWWGSLVSDVKRGKARETSP